MKKGINTQIEKTIKNNSTIEKIREMLLAISILSTPILTIIICDFLGKTLGVDFEDYLESKCGEICELTNQKINTITEYQDKRVIFESKITEVLSHEGPLLMNHKIFPHGCNRNIILEQTRHELAFKNAGTFLGKESLETGQTNFKLSYPGIGSHVAFITMLKEMININPEIENIQIYAPELIEGYSIIDGILIYLEEIKHISNYEFQKFELEHTTEVFLKFNISNTEITLHYHVDKNRERFVYEDETNFDLIILHDIGALTTELFMKELNEVATQDTRILGPLLASEAEGIKTLKPQKIEGAFHCEHSCANMEYQKYSKTNPKYSAGIITLKKTTPLYK